MFKSCSNNAALLSEQDLPRFLVLEVSSSHHPNDRVVYRPGIVKSIQHFTSELYFGDLGANGHPSLYRLLYLFNFQTLNFIRRVLLL